MGNEALENKINAICYNGIENLSAFKETIRSNYISKEAHPNLILIYTNEKPEKIHDRLSFSIGKGGILISPLSNYYARFLPEVWDWIKERGGNPIVFKDEKI